MGSQSPYQRTFTETLSALGWHHMHTRAVFDRAAGRMLTPHTAPGYPDITAVHPRTGVLLFAELKGACPAPKRGWSTSDLRPEQLDWLHRLHTNPAAAAVLFRPTDDWADVAGMLSKPGTLISGWGWLPPEDRRRIWTAQSITAIAR